MVGAQTSPERWARFLDEYAPGFAWLAATLMEWGELPPLARKAWRVTVSTSRGGDVSALAAMHEETGLLVVASLPGTPPPFLGEADRVTRLLGAPEVLEQVFEAVPMLAVRRLPGFRRDVFVHDGEAPPRHPLLRRAQPEEWEALERFRKESGVDPDPVPPSDLAGPAQRGLVWVLESGSGVAAMFRVEGVSRKRIQVTDICVHPNARGRGLGTAVMRSAAFVAHHEYTRGAVASAVPTDASAKTAARAGFTLAGVVDDVRLAT